MPCPEVPGPPVTGPQPGQNWQRSLKDLQAELSNERVRLQTRLHAYLDEHLQKQESLVTGWLHETTTVHCGGQGWCSSDDFAGFPATYTERSPALDRVAAGDAPGGQAVDSAAATEIPDSSCDDPATAYASRQPGSEEQLVLNFRREAEHHIRVERSTTSKTEGLKVPVRPWRTAAQYDGKPQPLRRDGSSPSGPTAQSPEHCKSPETCSEHSFQSSPMMASMEIEYSQVSEAQVNHTVTAISRNSERKRSWRSIRSGRGRISEKISNLKGNISGWVFNLGLENTELARDDREQSCFVQAVVRWVDWLTNLQEPQRTGWLNSLIYSRHFTLLTTSVIFANAIFEVVATDYEIAHVYEKPVFSFILVDIVFLTYYSIELILKLWLHKLYFFWNDETRWNIFDMLLVFFSCYDALGRVVEHASGTSFTFMRSLRVLKFARILRVVRMFRLITELRLLLNSMVGSIISLFWSFVVLLFIFYVFGLIFVQGVTNHLRELGEDADIDTILSVDGYLYSFRNVRAAMLTLYMAATGGDDWMNPYNDIRRTGVREAVLFLAYMLFVQVAVLNTVTAIIVENAMKLSAPDREAVALEQRTKDMQEASELRRLCHAIDTDKSGTISLDEFLHAYTHDATLRTHLALLGLNIYDAQLFFEMLKNIFADEEIQIDEFVSTCLRLRGNASSIDLQSLKLQMVQLARKGRQRDNLSRERHEAVLQQLKELCEK